MEAIFSKRVPSPDIPGQNGRYLGRPDECLGGGVVRRDVFSDGSLPCPRSMGRPGCVRSRGQGVEAVGDGGGGGGGQGDSERAETRRSMSRLCAMFLSVAPRAASSTIRVRS